MATPSATFTELVTTTNRNWSNRLTDNVTNHNALLRRLKAKDGIKTTDGGYEIVEQVEYAENGTYQRYFGYESLDTSSSDVLTSVKYPWQQVALHVVASGRELRMNSGRNQMINLVQARKKNAVHTAENQFSLDLYSDGTATNQINGLQALFTTDGTGTVGGIAAGTWTFWKNQFKEATGTNLAATPNATNAASHKADMNALYLSCTRGNRKPDLILASNDFYVLYETGEQQLQRYADGDMAKAGFMSIKFKGADVVHDENTNFASTAERMYFLNCNTLKLVQHSEAQWTMEKEKVPMNQDSVVIPTYWMGNLVCTARRDNGLLFDAA